MFEEETVPSLPHPDAPKWNADLLAEIQIVLGKDLSTDLLSMFPDQYQRQHRLVRSSELSWAGKINSTTLERLRTSFELNPEINILSEIPTGYNRRVSLATGPKIAKDTIGPPLRDFLEKLDVVETATVVYPLSETVKRLLADCICPSHTDRKEQSLVTTLKRILWSSPKLWESYWRGTVVRCGNDVVAKVTSEHDDYTEYTSMEYLLENAPDIPAPRPHGLISLGEFRVMFMSYISGTTLTKVWPDMSIQQKLSVRHQLDSIFSRLRTLRIRDGHVLGGVCGEGVKEFRVDEISTFKGLTSAAQYSDLQFSARHHGSNTYVKLLRSFLDQDSSYSTHELVFTHGDVRTDNIMVELGSDDDQVLVNAIIDWEDSGFYPDYYESQALSRTLNAVDENDWYLHLPDCISPLKFPQRWLVDRLWGIHLRNT